MASTSVPNGPPQQPETERRRKLWEMSGGLCSIIGTCLSMAELRRLVRKARLSFADNRDDYVVHARAVQLCAKECPLATLVHKALDKRYRAMIHTCAKAKTPDDLLAIWKSCLQQGDIPGPFWAISSHPLADEGVVGRVFGEVHMLSHLSGAANRADIRRLSRLERTSAAQVQALAAARARYRSVRHEKDELERRLGGELDQARREVVRLQCLVEELRGSAQVREALNLREALASLGQRLGEAEARNAGQRLVHDELRRDLARTAERERSLDEQVRHLEAERASLENALTALMDQEPACRRECVDGGECPLPRLCGRRVLYVGGRTNLVRHYQALVERYGGEFLHHDGGVECRRCALGEVLCRADLVMCPVDCISHDACLRVKKVCKVSRKQFLPLRSSGLSALARTLHEVGEGLGSGTEPLVS